MKLTILFVFLLSSSCSFKNPLKNQRSSGHNELYSEPEDVKKNPSDSEIKIVIAATSHISNSKNAFNFKFFDDHNLQEQFISLGGLNVIKSYQDILKSKNENILFLDPGSVIGDELNYSLEKDLYTQLGYDAITLGINDFNVSLPKTVHNSIENLKNHAQKSNTNIVISNLIDLKTATKVDWPGIKNHYIKEMNGIKIGVLGVLPDEISSVTPINNRIGLFIEDMLEATMSEARWLRSQGADIVIVLTNQSLKCGENLALEKKIPIKKVNFEPHRKNVCDLNSPLGQYLLRLPPKLVDVVVTGRNEEKVANYINNILVMGAHENGLSMIYSEIFYDKEDKAINFDKTVLHQPIFFCHEFFKNSNDCYHEDKTLNHLERVPAKFLGESIHNTQATKNFNINSSPQINYQEVRKTLEVDLIIKPKKISNSQLTILTLSGSELLNFLEFDYNNGSIDKWFPINVSIADQLLSVKVNKEDIHQDRNYRILADLDTLRDIVYLRQYIQGIENSESRHLSWIKYFQDDAVSTHLSSPIR